MYFAPFSPFHISTKRKFFKKSHYTLLLFSQYLTCSVSSLSLSSLSSIPQAHVSSREPINFSLLSSLAQAHVSSREPIHLSLLSSLAQAQENPSTSWGSLFSLFSSSSSREPIHFMGLSLLSPISTPPSPSAPISTAVSSHSATPPPLSSPSPSLIYPSSSHPSPPTPVKSPLAARSISHSLERISYSPLAPRLRDDYCDYEVELVLKLGLLCSNSMAAARPSMRQIVQYLEGDFALSELPTGYVSCVTPAPSEGFVKSFCSSVSSLSSLSGGR